MKMINNIYIYGMYEYIYRSTVCQRFEDEGKIRIQLRLQLQIYQRKHADLNHNPRNLDHL
jgi:hypothetical protein